MSTPQCNFYIYSCSLFAPGEELPDLLRRIVLYDTLLQQVKPAESHSIHGEVMSNKFITRMLPLLQALALVFIFGGSVHAAEDMREGPNIYRVSAGTEQGFHVWIVDGKLIRDSVIPEFLYGGNHEVYPVVPANEIWIDHAISCEEFHYTLMHELCERGLMAKLGWKYGAAHDSALMVELTLRTEDLRRAQAHERGLRKTAPTDFYGIKEIGRLRDSLTLRNIYRVFVATEDSIDIWIVDGATIRRDIYPDFGLSGNDLAYHFIPAKEIWLDAQISCEEMEYAIRFELAERLMLAGGVQYDDAYQKALDFIRAQRIELSKKAQSMPSIRIPMEKTLGK
jgi:hypothetical protein